MIRILTATILLLCHQVTDGQKTEDNGQRTDTSTVLWERTYTGTWQGLHPLTIDLAFDGTQYRGTITFAPGDLTFELEGHHEDGRAVLHEVDAEGRTSAYIVAQVTPERLTADWWSVDFSRIATLSLRNREIIELRKFIPAVSRISGHAGNTSLYMTVMREEQDLISGLCFLDGGEVVFQVRGVCADGSCDKMRLDITGVGKDVRTLQLTRLRGNTFEVVEVTEAALTRIGTASVENTYPLHLIHYADYAGTLDCLYPQTGTGPLQSWIETKVLAWERSVRMWLDSLALSDEGPHLRWSMSATGWVDFTLLNSDAASGLLTLYNPHTDDYERWPFIYGVREGVVTSVDALVRSSNFGATLLRDAAISGGSQRSPENAETPAMEHITLGPAGFVLWSAFDPVSGERRIVLPYRNYTDTLRRSTLIKNLMNL